MLGFRRPLARRPVANLLGTAARTAVIAGTAGAVTGAFRRRRQPAAPPPEPVAPPPPQTATGITDEQLNRLERLADLKKAGVLSTEEFETQKAAVLDAARGR